MRFCRTVMVVGCVPAWAVLVPDRARADSMEFESELYRLERLYEQGFWQVTAEEYRSLATGAGDDKAVPVAVGLARCLEQTGRYDEAIEALQRVAQRGRESPDWNATLASLLQRVGRYAEAIEACRAALSLDAGHMASRVRLGELYETVGRTDEAREVLAWFQDTHEPARSDRADDLVLYARGLYRSCVLSQHPRLRERTEYVLQELLQRAYERLDRRNWRARLAAGDLLLSKHNLPEAVEEFRAALRLNPYLADAHVGAGRADLEVWNFEGAEKHVRNALRFNPQHSGALHVSADLAMTQRRYKRAIDACQSALRINPHDPVALSTLAAAQLRIGRAEESIQTQERVAKINPRCALLHYTMARWLAAGRQFDSAEREFLKAIELAPWWVEPLTDLGLMYMETGSETAAEDRLKASFELDSFNRRTYNTLDLLETIRSFEVIESEHFILKYDPKRESAVGPYIIGYLESIHDEVCDDYGVEMDEKTIIEVFPTHAQFGVRITGRPWIHTIGACTGRVIAIDAPRPTTGYGRHFNWARVLRHEYTHAVTLAATNNRIPHWFTEGLAVFQEDAPPDWTWIQLLTSALRENRMFDLDSIDWGFIRPRRPDDRQLAYAQSEWMVQYIVSRWGYRAIEDLIEAFGRGLRQTQAFDEVLEISPPQFSQAFEKWAREQASPWGLPVDPLPAQLWLKAVRLFRPNDADNHATLAESFLLSGDVKAARDSTKRTLDLDSRNVSALRTLCRIVVAALEAEPDAEQRRRLEEHATDWLERLRKLAPRDRVGVKLAAATAMDFGHDKEAAKLYGQLKMICPADPVSYRRLAALALEAGRSDDALGNLIELWSYSPDDADIPIQIALLLSERGNDREALTWLMRAVYIDPYRVDLHRKLATLYSGSNQWEDALTEYRVLSGLEPEQADHWARLAECLRRLGRESEAKEAAQRAVALDENSPAQSILRD